MPAFRASGCGAKVKPQDFHTVAEVWLDNANDAGNWQVIDATGMARAASCAPIAVRPDAADSCFRTRFGQADLRHLAMKMRKT